MAYVPQKQIPQEEENQFARTDETTPTPPQAGGSAGAGGGGAGGVPGVASSTQFGSNAAKLSDYLKANKDQVGQFGEQVAGDLTNRYNQAKGSIDQGYNTFNQQVGQGYTPPDPSQINQALNDPANFAKDSKNVQSFQSAYNPQYGGPANFEGSSVYSDVNKKVNDAVSNAGLVNTQGGLGSYLNNFMGVNTTQGMKTLDTALLQRDPNSRKAIQDAAAPYQNLNSYLGDTTQKANQAVATKKEQVQKSGEDVRNQTKGVTDQFTKSLDDKMGSARTNAQAQADAFRAAIEGGGDLNADEQSLYGVNNWSDIQNAQKNLGMVTPFGDSVAKYGQKFDLTPYLSMQNPETSFNRENVASSDDYAREAALQALTGNQFNALPEDAQLAGTAPKSLAQFNSQGAGQDIKNRLLGLDQQFIDQYKDFNLGANDEAGWMNLLKNPKEASSYQGMIDIYNRNPDLVGENQRSVADRLQSMIQQANALPSGGGAGGGAGGGDAKKVPVDPAEGRVRVIDGQQKWWDGSAWVKPPDAARAKKDGTWEKFNYETGNYEPVKGKKLPVMKGSV